jgi:proline dehydrogenase
VQVDSGRQRHGEGKRTMQRFTRPAVLTVASIPTVERFFRQNRTTRGLVECFVAGETLGTALERVRLIAAEGMTVTLDLLGENVATEAGAQAAVAAYVETLRRMAASGLEPNISVKLTMLGFDLGEAVAETAMGEILDAARDVGGFVRVDMEGSTYTARTLDLVEKMHDDFPDEVGTVIQSYLYRSAQDVERLIGRRMRLRLVKGACAEPASVAYQKPAEVDASYVRLMERLLDAGRYPALATHDPALIRAAEGYATRMGIGSERFEFQMLYGVRREAQRELVRRDRRVRVYVPYGTEWYPYFTRRIAERPANALFVLRQLAG